VCLSSFAYNALNGYTALIKASHKGHTATGQVLVAVGAIKDAKDEVCDRERKRERKVLVLCK